MYVLTSDGSMDVYPGNKTSSFRISLKQPIDVGYEDWEVGLLNINYPYSWTNVGPAAGVYMKYFIDFKGGEKTIAFPDWQCQSMEEVLNFMRKEMGLKKNKEEKIKIRLDELGRFEFSTTYPLFDIGFSDNALKLLGLSGHASVHLLRITEFDSRQKMRNEFGSIFQHENPFDYSIRDKAEEVMKALDDNFEKAYAMLEPHINQVAFLKGGRIMFIYPDGKLNAKDTPEFKTVKTTMSNFWSLSRFSQFLTAGYHKVPETLEMLKGIIPGMLNPSERMFVYTNIIEPIDMNDSSVKMLKMVNTQGIAFKTTHEEYNQPTYLPLMKGQHSMIEILIMDASGTLVPFQNGTLLLTLHFQKASHQTFGRKS